MTMANDFAMRGIDVSEWQKEIDWKKVADDGVEFVMIRATHGKKTDVYFERNIKGALENNIVVGVYCCSYATTVDGVKAEAEYFLKTIEPYKDDILFPAAFDAEQDYQYKLGRAKVTELILTFCNAVSEAGYVPVNYTNCNWLNNVIDKPKIAEAGIDTWVSWPFNIKRWEDRPEDGVTKHEHTLWQFSCHGKVDGIVSNVDMNVSYIDYAAFVGVEELTEYVTWEEAAAILREHGIRGVSL